MEIRLFVGIPLRNIRRRFWFFLLLTSVFYLVQRMIVGRAKVLAEKIEIDIDNVVIEVVGSFRQPLSIFLSAYFSARALVLDEWTSTRKGSGIATVPDPECGQTPDAYGTRLQVRYDIL